MLTEQEKKYFLMAVQGAEIGTQTDYEIQVRCPVCGDSTKHKNKKRLHLYHKSNLTQVNCFNGDCAVHNKTMYSFLRDFFPDLLDAYRRETFTESLTKLSETGGILKELGTSLGSSQETPEEPKEEVTVFDLSPYFTKIQESVQALQYLEKRGLPYASNEKYGQYGQWYYGNQDLVIDETKYSLRDSVIIPLYYKGTMYGFYSRNINTKFFCTYMNEKNAGYKVWNWFNINPQEPVYIFEGIFDAISSGLTNVIALMGAKLPQDRLQEMKEPVFCLDFDRTGTNNSIEYAEMGYKVFVQPHEIQEKDMNDIKLKHPELIIPEMIQKNIHSGIGAIVRLKAML